MSYETDKNIEHRIKTIITDKLKNKEFRDNLNSEKIEIIEKLFEIFPELKDQKALMTNELLKNAKETQNESKEIILDEFNHNGITYYKDKFHNIWDENANLVGIVNHKENQIYDYIFFDQKFNLSKNIYDFI
jgi:hypothetical protein